MSIDNGQYLLLLLGCLVLTLPLEFLLGARVYRRPRRLGLTLLIAVPGFVVWDLIAAGRRVWWFSSEYVVGWRVLGLPIEEWLFFLVVPICALLTYEAVGGVLGALRHGARRSRSEVRHGR